MYNFMKRIIFLFSIIISNVIFAQSVKDLDIKNGFKHFKLGSTPNQIKNIKKEERQFDQSPNISEYVYVGKDIKTVFFVPVSHINLTFFKNKLYSIQVEFGDIDKEFTQGQFQEILSALENAYGRKWYQPTNETGVITNGAIWNGEKVRLELFRVNFSKSYFEPSDYDLNTGYILVYDKEMQRQRTLSEF